MTTIIGIQHEDRASIYVDSRVTDDNGIIYSHPDMKKYAERGAFIIAGSGETLPCDIAQKIWNPPRVLAKDKADIYTFMIVKVLPSLRECLKANGYNFDEDHNPKDGERFRFIIACNGELFDVDQELSVCKVDHGIYTAGSGGQIALGAVLVGANPMEALEAVSKVSAYTAPPFYIIEQFKD